MNKQRKYARFLLEGCLRLKEGDKLFIIADDIINDYVEIVIDEAHLMGINKIETLISFPSKEKELYLTQDQNKILSSPLIDKTKYNKMAKDGFAFLRLTSPLPNYFQDVDKNILNLVNQKQMNSIQEYRDFQHRGLIKWNICAVANSYWASDLNLSLEELWELIFKICLINDEDTISSWNIKMTKLKNRAKYLNDLHIDKLIYKNSLGTNLEIGLPKDYLFQSADEGNIVNMPTEEVFTSPDLRRVNGVVYASKILLVNNQVVKDFWLKFKEGRIIDFDAKEGREILKGIIETDEGSHYLGEVALVDYNSPISLTKVIFKNTLYDENAACHLAIGASFAECIKDGLKLDNEELYKRGLNYSKEHVDFFIGTSDLEIKAVLQNGEDLVIMEKGNFKEA